jgi:hypothetical protein
VNASALIKPADNFTFGDKRMGVSGPGATSRQLALIEPAGGSVWWPHTQGETTQEADEAQMLENGAWNV